MMNNSFFLIDINSYTTLNKIIYIRNKYNKKYKINKNI